MDCGDFGMLEEWEYHARLPVGSGWLSCLLIMVVLKSFTCWKYNPY